jgi:aspartyl/asparaginyl-tRNA synthetase
VNEKNSAELQEINSPLNVMETVPRFTYTKLVDKLNSEGISMEWGDDFDREKEPN